LIYLARTTKWRRYVFVGVVIAGLFMQLQFSIRYYGWKTLTTEKEIELVPSDLKIGGQFDALLLCLHTVPDLHEQFQELITPYYVIQFVPRQWWPEKPTQAAWEFYNAAYTAGSASNVTPSIIGQYYMNWGVIGVMMSGLWIGYMVQFADKMYLYLTLTGKSTLCLLVGLFYASILLIFRHENPMYFMYMQIAILIYLVLTTSSLRVRNTKDNLA
jgi:hypothetical protein